MNKIIAIGDLHGDYSAFTSLLRICKLIDSNDNWTGKDTYLIQLGDVLDGKRPGVNLDPEYINEAGEIKIINLLLKLDSQARNYSGRVISLIGNHELYPYYFRNNKTFLKGYVKKIDYEDYINQYKIARNDFYQPGNIGASLMARTRPLLFQHGEFLFIHGSVTESLIKRGLDSTGKVNINTLNNLTSNWLKGEGEIPSFLKNTTEENPVFSRLYSSVESIDDTLCKTFRNQLKFFNGVNFVVMGHSRFKKINATCRKMLIRTDVGLSRGFGGKLEDKNLQALEIIQSPGKLPELNIISKNGKEPL